MAPEKAQLQSRGRKCGDTSHSVKGQAGAGAQTSSTWIKTPFLLVTHFSDPQANQETTGRAKKRGALIFLLLDKT